MTEKRLLRGKRFTELNWVPVDPGEFVEVLQKWVRSAEFSGYSDVSWRLTEERDCYSNNETAILVLSGNRLETDEEYEKRLKQENENEERRYAEYKAMKQKFMTRETQEALVEEQNK